MKHDHYAYFECQCGRRVCSDRGCRVELTKEQTEPAGRDPMAMKTLAWVCDPCLKARANQGA